jgi:integrase
MRGHIRRRGASSWELKYDIDRVEGGRHTVYRSFKGTKREAAAELARLLARVADGADTAPNKLTVGQYVRSRIEQWVAAGIIGPKTSERYRGLAEAQIIPHLGNKLLQRLTPRDIEWWHTALQSSGRRDGKGGSVSARTIGHAHRVLSKALRDAVKHELVVRNVTTVQPPPKVAAEEIHILSVRQVAELPALLDGHPFAAPTTVALFSGLRRGELLALRWGNVDLGAKIIRVRESLEETKGGLRFKPPKSKAGVRDVTLPGVVVDALHSQRKQLLERRLVLGQGKLTDADLVFPAWDGSPRRPNSFSSAWMKELKAHGVQVSFHALRHTHASQLIAAGVDVVTISKRLGHASPNVTLGVYAHLFAQDDSKAADAINAVLGMM